MCKGAILAALGLLLVAASTGQPIGQQENRQEATANNANDPAEHSNISASLGRVAGALEAKNYDPNATEDRQRSRQDLIAQQDMARWTWWMMIAAFIALGLSSVGIVLIYLTFQETRDQSSDISRSVSEAAKSAAAMESVAKSMAVNAEQVIESVKIMGDDAEVQRTFGMMNMRAYIDVVIGGALYQTPNLRFQAEPFMKNTGNTPARKIGWRIAADILPVPLPADFSFPLPPKSSTGSNVLGSLQGGGMVAVVPDRVADADVAAIKGGHPKALYVWGVITYEDMFRKKHTTEFAQQLYWERTGEVREDGTAPEIVKGFHLERHNRTT
jgi:hypothetical protein